MINNTFLGDHIGLFIYLDLRYPSSFHNATILRHYELHVKWADMCTHNNKYFEYLLGGPKYQGHDMYIMWRLGRQEVSPNANNDAVNAFNKMHVNYRVVWSAHQWP